jgi:hypothetical protein
MTKKEEYFQTAETMYVKERFTIEEIAKRLPISERSLRYWMDEGLWKEKRKEHERKTRKYHENILETVTILGDSIRQDIEKGEEPSTSRINAFSSLVSVLEKMKKYEESMATETKTGPSTGEDPLIFFRKELGLE